MMQYTQKHVADYNMRYTASADTYQRNIWVQEGEKTLPVSKQTHDGTLEVMTNK